MYRPSSLDACGSASAEDASVRQRRDPDYSRSVLGIAALIEPTDSTGTQTSNTQVYQQSRQSTGEASENVGVTQTQGLSDNRLPQVRRDPGASQEFQTNTTHVSAGGAVDQETNELPHMSPHAELPSISMLQTSTSGSFVQSRIQLAPLSSSARLKADPRGLLLEESDASSGWSTSKPRETAANLDLEANDAPPDRQGGNENACVDEQPEYVDRRESLLSSPLRHPNGTFMFPDLSTPQQEEIAQEALVQAEESIIADNNPESENGSDGGYESDGFSSASTSAESSVRDYMFENGRRYHRFREGHYNFPNDDVEQEREDMKHAMVKLLCSQKLHFAPIGSNPQEMLDIGTGTGIWAIEMGDMFPSAHILGVDLSPIQPDWLPPNVRFMVDDAESPWLYPRNHFDYIHSRHTVMAIKDWDTLYRRAFEHLKPGAWIEMQEIHHRPRSANVDGSVPPEHPVAKFWTLITEGLDALGVDLEISAGGNLPRKMEEAGFTNVTERVFHVPIGTWPKNKVLKTVGLYWRTILLDGLQAIALGPLTRGLRWNREQVEMFLMEVRRAYHDNTALMYMPLYIVYGQKPTTAY